MARRSRAVFRFLVPLFVFICAAMVAEALLRVVAPPWLTLRMHEVRAGRSLADFGDDAGWPVTLAGGRPFGFQAGARFRVRADEYSHEARTDEFGGRVVGQSRAVGLPIVPVLGDSFTFGIGVNDGETFVSLISAAMPARLINLGFPGTALPHQLDIFNGRHVELGEPSVCVFVFFLGNDFADIVSAAGVALPASANPTGLMPTLRLVNRWLDQRRRLSGLYLVQWIRALAIRVFSSRHRAQSVDPLFLLMSQNPETLAEIRPALRSAVDRLARVARERGFTPLVIVIPDRHQVDATLRAEWARYYGYAPAALDPEVPNGLISSELRRIGVASIDATPCLRDVSGAYYVRDNHLTATGHRAVAACLEGPVRSWLTSALARVRGTQVHGG